MEYLSDVQVGNQLNFIGQEGWELVQVMKVEGEFPLLCIFKRSR